MREELHKLKNEIQTALDKAKNEEDARGVELKFFSRKGIFTGLIKDIATLPGDERKEAGMLANEIKKEVMARIESFKPSVRTESGSIDMTLPGDAIEAGHLHPITRIREELEDLFTAMGFMVLEGPELESDFYNFEALNIPPYHPARDMQDTFYIDRKNENGEYNLVLRTHTSPMQVRAMQKYGAPLRCVVPGRVFRAEATDAVHEHTFDQLEGLMIGKDISISNLTAVMHELINGVFGREMEVRIRPGYFPFVEPGIEMDIRCTICGGAKCPSCKHSGWLEILPAGMVHPKVLEYGNIDNREYSGFAFGLGLTRLAMMKYGIGDIRLFSGSDLRFLGQF